MHESSAWMGSGSSAPCRGASTARACACRAPIAVLPHRNPPLRELSQVEGIDVAARAGDHWHVEHLIEIAVEEPPIPADAELTALAFWGDINIAAAYD